MSAIQIITHHLDDPEGLCPELADPAVYLADIARRADRWERDNPRWIAPSVRPTAPRVAEIGPRKPGARLRGRPPEPIYTDLGERYEGTCDAARAVASGTKGNATNIRRAIAEGYIAFGRRWFKSKSAARRAAQTRLNDPPGAAPKGPSVNKMESPKVRGRSPQEDNPTLATKV